MRESELIIQKLKVELEKSQALSELVQKHLALSYSVVQILAQPITSEKAIPAIFELICENLAWDFGAFWKVNPATNRLNCAATWVSNTPHKQKERWDFEAVTRKLTFAPGEGLPGRIMETARPLWIPDLQLDKNFPRLQSALTGGLNAAIGFPILFKEQVLGVLEFFSETNQEPDKNFMVMLAALGSQIGQFPNL